MNQYLQNATANALNAYNNYIDSITTVVRGNYMQHCLAAVESLRVNYQDKQYHYTLYNYDQAGNLIRTVPPQGVQLFGITKTTDPLEQQIIADRTAGQHNVFNNNVLASTYVYNSLNQLTEQSVPDDDNMQIWNFNLPTGLTPNLVVTGTQFTDATNGYLSGYVPNGSGRRGYLYKTHDGGHTWQIINGTVAATMNGVVMTSAANGYAVGNDGVVLITADGGNSWDIVPLYAKGVTQTLKGVAYDGAGNVAIVGSGTAFSLAGTTYAAGTGISSTDVLISVTYDAVNTAFYAVGDSSGYGVMYKGVLASGAYAWTKLSNNTASLPLYKVQFLGNNVNGSNAASGLTGHGFATGMGGMLLHTTDRGAHWFAVPTYMHQLIRNIYFVNDNIGVALVDSVPHTSQLYQTADGGVTWSLLSKPGQYYYDMSFYYDNSATAVTSHAYKGVAVGYNGIVSRIVTSGTLASPYFGLITLNSPSSYNLMGVFAEVANGKLYMTMGSSGNYMYYTGAGLSNTATQVTWDSVNCSTSVFKTAFVLAGSNYTLLPAAIGETTHELYTFTSLTTSPWLSINSANDATNPSLTTYNTSPAFYEMAEHGTVDGNDSLYAYNNNGSSSGGLYSLYAASSSATELTVKPFGVTTAANITSLAYSGGGNIAGVDSIDGNIYTGVINSTPGVTWTNVSTNIHPLSLYSIQAVGASATTLYASGLRGEFLSGTATGGAINLTELVPVTTKALFSAQAESASPALGIAAGDSSALYQFNYTGGAQNYTPTYTAIPTSSGVAPLYDVAISGTTAYVSGGSGTIYYIPSISANIAQHAISSGKASFIGITTTTHGGAIAVGSNANIWLYGGTAGIQSTAIYCPGFNAENFYSDNNHGYVAGWAGTIRRTDDGGNTWQVVLPEINSSGVPDYKTVWTTSTGNAIIGGTGGFVGSAGPSNTVTNAGTGYAYNSSSTQTWYKARFNANYPSLGYMVGSNNGVLTLTVNSGALATSGVAPLSTAIPAPGSAGTGTFPVSDLHSLHVFRDNSFMVVGSNGAIYYYNAVASSQWNDESPTAVASYGTYTWMDIDARDDRTMWVVGNSSSIGGSIIKVIDPVNIQPNIPLTYSVTPIGSAWALEPIADGPTANNIVTNANQVTINAIAFSGPYDGFLGGSYSSTPPSNTGGYPYARIVTDKGGIFSTLNWYDRIGRLVISQNTRQHNYTRQAYSYILFDALGRSIEAGQKTENSDATLFNTIFGDSIMGFYNPNAISQSKYLTWIKDNTGPRTEVIHTYYDSQDILPSNILMQNELRNRIATATYSDTLRNDSTKFNSADYYSYDVIGNVATLIKDDSIYGISGQRYKRMDFQYDLVANKINELDYQSNNIDQYHTKFQWDQDNRITSASTSKDSILWDQDAKYFYYPHGSLARVELGDQEVQGMDYAYTLQGWIKGVNSDQLGGSYDIGHDALQQTGNLNSCFARDAMGYTLDYYTGDYDPIDKINYWNNINNRFEADGVHSDLMNGRHDGFLGNVSAMVTNITQPKAYSESNPSQQAITLPQGTSYNYDQLNRLIDMKAYQNLNPTTNTWETGSTYDGLYHDWLTYDENGNILTQKRADSIGEVYDSLTYHYNIQGGITLQNRLYHVNDKAAVSLNNDIKDEGNFLNSTEHDITERNNYRYNALGELAKDSIAGLDTIIWNLYNKVWKIRKHNGDSILFGYDAQGNRIMKKYKPFGGQPMITYYVRNAEEDILAVYNEETKGTSVSYALTEREIYGSKRIGSENTNVELISPLPFAQVDTFSRYIGVKEYELDNHLNNVLVVISDRKIPRPDNTGNSISYYESDVISSNDYYGFGMLEPGRNFNSALYRYGFNGKEKDNETYGNANEYDYGKRLYDPRLGRFMSIDPLIKKYPMITPYLFASNSPIASIDLMGLESKFAVYGAGDDHGAAGFKNEANKDVKWGYSTEIHAAFTVDDLKKVFEDETSKGSKGQIDYVAIYSHSLIGHGVILNNGEFGAYDEQHCQIIGQTTVPTGSPYKDRSLSEITKDPKINFSPDALVIFAGCESGRGTVASNSKPLSTGAATDIYSVAQDFTKQTGIASIGSVGETSNQTGTRTADYGYHLFYLDENGKLQDYDLKSKTLDKATIKKAQDAVNAVQTFKEDRAKAKQDNSSNGGNRDITN
ncbi:MAG TPA: RHS repeat-associated core domain-containing protein [Bacteroidia bacterium]|nr:RHS repeat-associated core domain-containing protein [Bacteroidia bacterium]